MKDLRGWQLLEESFEEPLRDKWRALQSMPKIASDPQLIDAFFELASLANGFANQAAHMTGYLVQEVLQVGDENGIAPEQVLDDLVASLDAKSYAMYRRHLEECKCGACEAVLQYDDCRQGEVEGRPSHCVRVEPWAQTVRKFSRGLSGTTLRNCEYFFASTPKMSPPTLSLATPTDVQSCTRRYMNRYLQGLPADYEDYPEQWLRCTPFKHIRAEMVEVSRDLVAMLDGDSGHLVIDKETDDVLLAHITHRYRQHNTIRFRTMGNDAPELATAFRLYGEHVGRSTRRQVLRTYHSGVESMRCARRILAISDRVFFRIHMDESGLPAHDLDKYNRLLVEIYVEENDGDECALLAERIAEEGHTFPILDGGLDKDVFDAMVRAKQARSGSFQLPHETRQFPFRPWDTRDESSTSTKEYSVDDDHITSFVMLKSPLANEGLVYVAPSTIPNAGMGLFLRPRQTSLPAGSYLCKYATSYTAERPTSEAGKSVVITKPI